jgi:hypothetical protein
MEDIGNPYRPPLTKFELDWPIPVHYSRPPVIWFKIFYSLSWLWICSIGICSIFTAISQLPTYKLADLKCTIHTTALMFFWGALLFSLVLLFQKKMSFLFSYYLGVTALLISRFARDVISHESQTYLFWLFVFGVFGMSLFRIMHPGFSEKCTRGSRPDLFFHESFSFGKRLIAFSFPFSVFSW